MQHWCLAWNNPRLTEHTGASCRKVSCYLRKWESKLQIYLSYLGQKKPHNLHEELLCTCCTFYVVHVQCCIFNYSSIKLFIYIQMLLSTKATKFLLVAIEEEKYLPYSTAFKFPKQAKNITFLKHAPLLRDEFQWPGRKQCMQTRKDRINTRHGHFFFDLSSSVGAVFASVWTTN